MLDAVLSGIPWTTAVGDIGGDLAFRMLLVLLFGLGGGGRPSKGISRSDEALDGG